MADSREYREVPQSFELEDLVAELQEIADRQKHSEAVRPPRTYRTAEIQDALGVGKHAALKKVKEWKEAGLCQMVRAPHENAWGVVQSVPMVKFIDQRDRALPNSFLDAE